MASFHRASAMPCFSITFRVLSKAQPALETEYTPAMERSTMVEPSLASSVSALILPPSNTASSLGNSPENSSTASVLGWLLRFALVRASGLPAQRRHTSRMKAWSGILGCITHSVVS